MGQVQGNNPYFKQLDSYSLLIVSKYFKTPQDFINVICVNSKFQETTEKLRYNPIPITSLKLFPKIQTQHLYSNNDIKIEGIGNYEIWNNIDYDQYMKYKENNIKFHNVTYTKENIQKYGTTIPNNVTALGKMGLYNNRNVSSYFIPKHIKSIENRFFYECYKLQSVELSNNLTVLKQRMFTYCTSLTSIQLPTTLQLLKKYCFSDCSSLQTIIIPNSVTEFGNNLFCSCVSLQSIKLPTKLLQLKECTFFGCSSLKKIELPLSLISIGYGCFRDCPSLNEISIPSKVTSIGTFCFQDCSSITSISIPSDIKLIEKRTFSGCTNLKHLSLPLQSNKEYRFPVTEEEKDIIESFNIKCTNVIIQEQITDIESGDEYNDGSSGEWYF